MDNPYEAVLEDVMTRIVEERGTEVLALDWSIMDQLHEATNHEKFGKAAIGKPHGLRKRLDGVGLAQDKQGFYVRTHRARCKSYPSPEKIPLDKVRFIRSTG